MAVRFLLALVRVNLLSSVALRGNFLLQMFFMAFNNLIWFSVWWIYFTKFPEINGWKLPEAEAMYGFATAAFGLCVVFCAGSRQLAQRISEGELDALLVQPKNVMLQVIFSRSQPSGWGDICSSVVFFSLSGYCTGWHLPLILFCIFCGVCILTCTAMNIGALAFWLGPVDQLARQLFEFFVSFNAYPQTIYSSWFRLFLFTLIPAGFMTFVPVELLRDFHWTHLLALVCFVPIYVAATIFIFQSGLRRYESGNKLI